MPKWHLAKWDGVNNLQNYSFYQFDLKSRLHYQSFLVQENLVKVFDANFDSVNGQRKL